MKRKSKRGSIKAPSKKEPEVLECQLCRTLQVQRFMEGMGAQIDFVYENMIWVNSGMLQIMVDEDGSGELWVSFHLNTDPGISARIMGDLSMLSSILNMQVRVGDSYAFEFDESGHMTDIPFGDDAYRSVGRDPFDFYG